MGQFTGGPWQRFAVRLGVAVAAISMVCSGAMQFVDATPKSVAIEVAPTAAISQTPTTVGVADSAMYFYSQDQIEKTLDALQAMGVQNVRIMIPWAGVQVLGPNSYIWQNLDWAVDAANARNMGVLGVLEKTPWWAGTPSYSGHPDPQEYAKWAGAVAERYAGRISAYEIWNEPNSKLFYDPVDPAAYTELLKAAYPVIKEADPAAIVVGGVVASLINVGQFTMNPVDFVAGMYDAGAHGYFDALSFHPYSYTLLFSQGAGQAASPLRQLRAIRELMVEHGDGLLKVWATEYGQPTSEGSEQEQADFTEDFLNSWQTVEGTGPIFLYTTRDIDSASILPSETLGLFFDNGQPKLAAYVVAAFLGSLPPGPLPDDRSLLARLAAAARELVRITGEVIQFGVQATVGVIQYLVTSTVAWIRGVANFTVDVVQAGVQLVRDIVDRITNGPSPPAMAVAALSDGLAPAALRATQASAAAIDAAAQKVSAQDGPVAVGDPAEAAAVTTVETPSTGESGDVSAGVLTAVGQSDATGVQQEAAEPTTAEMPTTSPEPTTTAKPTTSAEPTTPPKPSGGSDLPKPDVALSEPVKKTVKPSQANQKDEPLSTPKAKHAAAGGDGSATDGAETASTAG